MEFKNKILFLLTTTVLVAGLTACAKKRLVEMREAPASTVTGSATLTIDISVPGPVSIDEIDVLSDETYRDMYFKHYGVNPTIDTQEAPISTFSVDVDDASFTLARSYFDKGLMPPEEAIRV